MPRKPPGDGNVIPIKATDRAPAQPRKKAPSPTGNRTSPKVISAAERRSAAVQLRRAGYTFTEIAAELAEKFNQPGYNRPSAYRDVREALDRIIEEPARELKEEELSRLAALQAAHWDDAINADDRDVRVKAGTFVLKVMQHRARLVGLESPIKHDVSGTGSGEITVNLNDPAELQQAGLELLEQLVAPSKRKAAAEQASGGP